MREQATQAPEGPQPGPRRRLALLLLTIALLLILTDWAARVALRLNEELSAWPRPARSTLGAYTVRHVDRKEFRLEYRCNSLGLRDREPEPDFDGLTVLCLGDSFTMGVGVELEETWVRRLERLLVAADGRPLRTVNAGVPGAAPIHHLDTWRRLRKPTRPDAVIVHVHANDLNDTRWPATRDVLSPASMLGRVLWEASHERRSPLWRRAVTVLLPGLSQAADAVFGDLVRGRFVPTAQQEAGIDLHYAADILAEAGARLGYHPDTVRIRWARLSPGEREALADLICTGRQARRALPLYYRVVGYRPEPIPIVDSPDEERAWCALCEAMAAMAHETTGDGARLLVLYSPSREQAGRQEAPPPAFRALLADWCAARHVPFLDLTPLLDQETVAERIYYQFDGHWTPFGHRLAARAIAGLLESEGLARAGPAGAL